MSKATAGVVLNPQPGDRFAFLETATLVANAGVVTMIMPDGRKIDLGEPVEDMQVVLVAPQRVFFSRGRED